MTTTTAALSSKAVDVATTTLQHDDNSDNDSIDDNDPYIKMIQFESIRNKDGLEESISVQWPESRIPLRLSTLLEPDDLAPLFDGAGWAGTRVWHAAIASVKFLVDCSYISKDTCLLELGCGLGVPGMLLHSIYNCNVCLTDQESILSQLETNVKTNFPDSNDRIVARPLSWSRQGMTFLLQSQEHDFNVVLNCDCVYEPLYGDSWKLLVECIDMLLQVNPNTIVVTSVERRAADGIDKFLDALQQAPNVSTVTKEWEDVNYRIEIYVARGVTAE